MEMRDMHIAQLSNAIILEVVYVILCQRPGLLLRE
jgi:hypothetical protein